MSVFIVIPAHNESKNIVETLCKTKKFAENIVVIDDGSKDDTFKQIRTVEGIIALHHGVNLGKGAALKTGCDYAIKKGAKKIVVLDADGQHNPNRIPEFLAELDSNEVVFGYRKRSKNMPLILRLGNWYLNKSIECLFKIKINDTQCGFRGFTAEAYKLIRWNSNDYSVESEMIANTGKEKLKYIEIPIETIYNDRYKGTNLFDGITIFLKMILWRIN